MHPRREAELEVVERDETGEKLLFEGCGFQRGAGILPM